ncbi:MAG TPA: hypothetical protein VFS34_03060 [Thermoanaerobaculia bacterium]|nr:hypothetical protein [Thermoanaerobaculia bacterium]
MSGAFWISPDPETPGGFRILATEPADNPRRYVLADRASAGRFLRDRGASESDIREALDAAIREGRSSVFVEPDGPVASD